MTGVFLGVLPQLFQFEAHSRFSQSMRELKGFPDSNQIVIIDRELLFALPVRLIRDFRVVRIRARRALNEFHFTRIGAIRRNATMLFYLLEVLRSPVRVKALWQFRVTHLLGFPTGSRSYFLEPAKEFPHGSVGPGEFSPAFGLSHLVE